MLLFNYNGTTVAEQKAPFQNISCYCLTYNIGVWLYYLVISKHLMLLFNKYLEWRASGGKNFKTSHVIV